jgi:hypothetical protein
MGDDDAQLLLTTASSDEQAVRLTTIMGRPICCKSMK